MKVRGSGSRFIVRAAAVLAVVLVAGVAFAHHTPSYIYDVQKRVELTGTVTSVEWKNPHVLVHLAAKAQDGTATNWTLEARAVYIMRRNGFSEDFLKVGDTAKLTVCMAKDGSPTAGLEAVTYPDGTLPKVVGECVIPK